MDEGDGRKHSDVRKIRGSKNIPLPLGGSHAYPQKVASRGLRSKMHGVQRHEERPFDPIWQFERVFVEQDAPQANGASDFTVFDHLKLWPETPGSMNAKHFFVGRRIDDEILSFGKSYRVKPPSEVPGVLMDRTGK